ncbi:MAG: nitrile hydratase subunit alpha [Candidatus Rariloculaceae bacterium]
MAGDGHSHDDPPNPFLTKRHSDAETEALAERTRWLEDLLVAKGYVEKDTLDRIVDLYENDIGPLNGAKVVARAWTDRAFKKRLFEDATPAIAELGFGGIQGEHMVVVENTADVHNMVVCSLCSCYPWPVLGLPPTWYKDPSYRSRALIDPRGVLLEFGLELPPSTEVRVWDSSAEIRYLVLPQRPSGTDDWLEEKLQSLVSRDSMIGVAVIDSSAD